MYILTKGDSKPWLVRWIFLLQEFDFEIENKKIVENVVADRFSRLKNSEVTKKEKKIVEESSNEHLFVVIDRPWFADMTNFKADNIIINEFTW